MVHNLYTIYCIESPYTIVLHTSGPSGPCRPVSPTAPGVPTIPRLPCRPYSKCRVIRLVAKTFSKYECKIQHKNIVINCTIREFQNEWMNDSFGVRTSGPVAPFAPCSPFCPLAPTPPILPFVPGNPGVPADPFLPGMP